MEIHVLDWIVYLIFLSIIFYLLKDWQKLDRILFPLIYTVIYSILFYYFNWVDLIHLLKITL